MGVRRIWSGMLVEVGNGWKGDSVGDFVLLRSSDLK